MKGALVLCLFLASLFASSETAPCCGDGKCEYPVEDCKSCPQDCGICAKCTTCGNRVCDSLKGETSCNCPSDCGPCCVDSYCREDKGETAQNCPEDCGVALRIRVVDDATSAPLPGAAVRCNIPPVSLGPSQTDVNGRTRFDGAQGGEYRCTAELFSYLPGFTLATVFPVSNPTEYVIRLKLNPACIQGTVFDAITLAKLDLASVYCNHTGGKHLTATRVTGTMGGFYYEPVPFGTYRCHGSRTLYFPNSNEGTADPGKMAVIDIYLNPAPGGIIGHVWYRDGALIPIPNTRITCTHAAGFPLGNATTDSTGFYHIPNVPAGNVACTATVPLYTVGIESGVIFRSLNTTIDFILGELPGTLLVTVREQGSLTAISGATVSCVGRSPLSTLLTNVTGQVFHGTALAGNYTCTASAAFYDSNSNGGVVFRAQNTEIIILLKPSPKVLVVTVRNSLTNALITTASVTLAGATTGSAGVDSVTASATFNPVAIGGGYSASASADGYVQNSTAFGPILLTTSTPINVIVYLAPLPCTLTVVAYDATIGNTSAVIAGAAISLNLLGAAFQGTTGPNGRVSFSIPAGSTVTTAFASRLGYKNGSAPVESCPQGGNHTTFVPLTQVLVIFFRAIDATSPTQAVIQNVNLVFNGQLLTNVDPSLPGGRFLEVDSLPISNGILVASAPGFNNKTNEGVSFSLSQKNYTISLAPQPFTLFFVPAEQVSDGPTGTIQEIQFPAAGDPKFAPDAGTIYNNYLIPCSAFDSNTVSRCDGNGFNTKNRMAATNNVGDGYSDVLLDGYIVHSGITLSTQRKEQGIFVGGQVSRRTANPTTGTLSQALRVAFGHNNATYTDGRPLIVYGASYSSVVPTSSSVFILTPDSSSPDAGTPIIPNYPTGALSASGTLNITVPAYASQSERSLVFTVPVRLNTHFLVIRYTVIARDNSNQGVSFGQNDFLTHRLYQSGEEKNTNVDFKVLETRTGARPPTVVLVEYAIPYGRPIDTMETIYPAENFNNVTSNWVSVAEQDAMTYNSSFYPISVFKPMPPGSNTSSVTNIPVWPPVADLAKIFPRTVNGQRIRDLNARIWTMRNFVFVRVAKKKKNPAHQEPPTMEVDEVDPVDF